MFQVYIGIMDDLPPFTGDDVARVCSPVLFPAWCDSSLCERRGAIFSLAITEAFPSESASTLRIETFGCVFQTVGECDRRPWSLCGIMNDAVMSPGSQVGAHLEGEKKKKRKKGTRYGIVYNTSERASLYNCEKRSCGKLAASLTGDLSVDDITRAPRGSHLTKGVTAEFSCYGVIILLKHRIFLSLVQSFAVSASLKST